MDLMAGRSRGTPPRGSRRLRRWRRVARRPALLLSLAMALLALTAPSGTPLSAQDVAPGPVVARVSGVVFDSVAARPLTGAIVQLVPAAERAVARSVQTDQSGSFAFDSLGAGRYLLGFFHPLLDSLGLAAPITVIDIRVSGAMRVPLATPSARTLVTNLCGPRALADSTGAFIGYVRSATDAMGRPKAQVRVSWSELVIAADGIRRTAPSVQGEASDAGGLALCGIPIGAQVVARAWSGTDSSGFAELDVPPNGLLRRDLYVGASQLVTLPADTAADSSAVASAVLRGSGVLRGEIRRPDGRALPGVRLVFWGTGIEVTSGADGAYRMQELPEGTFTVEARALGFLPHRRAVDILAGSDAVANLTMESFGTFLDTVKVTAQRVFTSRQMQEFEQRRKSGFGHFMDEDAINRRNPFYMSDLLRMTPGVQIARGQGFGDRVLMRGTGFNAYCAPTVFLDGMRVFNVDGDLDAIVNVQDVRAIEVYTRGGSVPVQFQTLEGCGALVVWTGGRRASR